MNQPYEVTTIIEGSHNRANSHVIAREHGEAVTRLVEQRQPLRDVEKARITTIINQDPMKLITMTLPKYVVDGLIYALRCHCGASVGVPYIPNCQPQCNESQNSAKEIIARATRHFESLAESKETDEQD